MTALDAATWNTAIAGLPNAHILQTWEWAELKSRNGWQPLPQQWRDSNGKLTAAAMVLKRSLPAAGFAARMCVLYVPRGPLMDWSDAGLRARVLADLQRLAHRQGAIFIKMDPELVLGRGVPETPGAVEDATGQAALADLRQNGWFFSSDQVQFRNTVWMDLTNTEDELLARMKQKTRYNLRLAQKKGVTVERGTLDDLPLLYRMYAETSLRDGFVIRGEEYYLGLWREFIQRGLAHTLIARVDGEDVGGLVLFTFAGKAWYMFGMSRDLHREKMPTYLLQWQAILLAKSMGCSRYDLWGAPDVFDESDSMWGVYRFKEGLGGEVIRTLGAWDYTSRPLLYRLYTNLLPRILDVMRRRGKQHTRQSVSV